VFAISRVDTRHGIDPPGIEFSGRHGDDFAPECSENDGDVLDEEPLCADGERVHQILAFVRQTRDRSGPVAPEETGVVLPQVTLVGTLRLSERPDAVHDRSRAYSRPW
jgi:hypothetical protein